MARRLGSARAAKTCSAIASASGGIEVVGQLLRTYRPLDAIGKGHESLQRWQPFGCYNMATDRLRQQVM
jgi:hypothetical protein